MTKIRSLIDSDYTVEGDLRRTVSLNIKRLLDLGCYFVYATVRDYLFVVNVLKRMLALVKVSLVAIAGKKKIERIIIMAKAPIRKRRDKKNITSGIAHINSTFNNTMITITDVQGNAISGLLLVCKGLKVLVNLHLSARQIAPEDAGRKAQEHGLKTLR